MDEPDQTADDDTVEPAVVVAVTRTGGMAGMRRRWRVEPPEDEASAWVELITRCPWDAVTDADAFDPTSADRFSWRIRARCGEELDRIAELADRELTGAWRDLVDAVRDASRQA